MAVQMMLDSLMISQWSVESEFRYSMVLWAPRIHHLVMVRGHTLVSSIVAVPSEGELGEWAMTAPEDTDASMSWKGSECMRRAHEELSIAGEECVAQSGDFELGRSSVVSVTRVSTCAD